MYMCICIYIYMFFFTTLPCKEMSHVPKNGGGYQLIVTNVTVELAKHVEVYHSIPQYLNMAINHEICRCGHAIF